MQVRALSFRADAALVAETRLLVKQAGLRRFDYIRETAHTHKKKAARMNCTPKVGHPTFGVFFMAKYSEAFKRKVVEEYRAGKAGYKALAKKYGLDHSMVRRWIHAFQSNGPAGLKRRKYQRYAAELKLTVLQRMWAENLSYRQAAAIFDIRSVAQIGLWERQYHSEGLKGLAPKPKGRKKKMQTTPVTKLADSPAQDDHRTREQLLTELEHLRAEVAYLKKLEALELPRKKSAPGIGQGL